MLIVEGRGGGWYSGICQVEFSPVIGLFVCSVCGINLFLPRLPPSLFPNNGTCSSVVPCGLVLLFVAARPAVLPTAPPTIPQKGTYAQIPMENVVDYKRQQNTLKRFDEDMLNENDSIKKKVVLSYMNL